MRQVDDKDGFLFWEDVFDPLPRGADVAEIALRALRLDCNEVYILPAYDWITIQFHRQHKAFPINRIKPLDRAGGCGSVRSQRQAPLTTGHRQIDLGEQLGIEQRPMKAAIRIVHTVAFA